MKHLFPKLLIVCTLLGTLPAFAYTPEDYTRVSEEAIRLYKAGSLTDAATLMEKATAIAPMHLVGTAHNNLAALYMKQALVLKEKGQVKAALIPIRQALYWMELAWPEDQTKSEVQNINTRKAKETYTILFQQAMGGNSSSLHMTAAQQLQASGQLKAAAVEYVQVLANSDNKAAHEALGDIYQTLNMDQKTLRHYSAALKGVNVSQHATLALKLAQAYFKSGREDDALKTVNLLLSKESNKSLGMDYLKQFWGTLREENPQNVTVLMNLAEVYYRNGERGEAKNYLVEAERVLVQNPTLEISTELRYALRTQYTRILIDEGNTPAALTFLQEISILEPTNAQVVAQLWHVYTTLGRYEEADAVVMPFLNSPLLPEDHAQVLADEVLRYSAIPKEQTETFIKWLDAYPTQTSWLAVGSNALAKINAISEAIKYTEQWKQMAPSAPAPLRQLATLFGRLGMTTEKQAAIQDLEKLMLVSKKPSIIQQQPATQAPSALEAAYVALTSQQYGLALMESQKAMVNQKDSALAQYYAGLSHEGLKQPDQAIYAYQQSLAVGNGNVPEAAYALGILLNKQQQPSEAKAALQQFLDATQALSPEKKQRLQPQITYARQVLSR